MPLFAEFVSANPSPNPAFPLTLITAVSGLQFPPSIYMEDLAVVDIQVRVVDICLRREEYQIGIRLLF